MRRKTPATPTCIHERSERAPPGLSEAGELTPERHREAYACAARAKVSDCQRQALRMQRDEPEKQGRVCRARAQSGRDTSRPRRVVESPLISEDGGAAEIDYLDI